jgi:hypothetical protein
MPETFPADLIRSMSETCGQCDDVYQLHDDSGIPSCVSLDHQPVVTDRDIVMVVCERCKGHGILRGFPGVYTAADRAEWLDEDYDHYLEYTRTCEDCGGIRVQEALSDEALQRPKIQEWIRDFYDLRAIERAERWAGA